MSADDSEPSRLCPQDEANDTERLSAHLKRLLQLLRLHEEKRDNERAA
jgi:hypothetical protein